MDYEKAYKEALEKIREGLQPLQDGSKISGVTKAFLEEVFPELKESEDERIRKGLIKAVSGTMKGNTLFSTNVTREEAIAWLEKQKSVGEIVERCKNSWYNEGKIAGMAEGLTNDEKYQQGWHDALEKQGDKESSNKVEPKFKIGDWITDGEAVFHITSYDIDYGYQLETQKGTSFHFSDEKVKNKYHLWTIADAKDGDVLYSLDSKQPFIFKHRKPNEQAKVYCGINTYGMFFIWNTKDCVITTDKYIPATKEQRDTLFKAMTEKGYEWDAEKKELKKIEQKPVNDTVETIVEAVSNTSILDMIEDKDAFTNPGIFENSLGRLLKLFEKLPKQDLLDGLKFYANVVKHDGEYVKPTWSEEDEEILKNLIDYFSLDDGLRLPTEETVDWLKSLKERLS